MSYTAIELITDAYKLSSLVSRELEYVQGYQLNDGLKWFNQLLADTALDYGAIPYITTYYEFNGVPGQEKYYLRNLIDIQSCVFFIQAIRYEMKYTPRKAYFSLPRANNISALPLSYTYERAPHGVNFFCYFYPQEPYVIQIVGNMYLNMTTINQDLTICTANLGVPIMSLDDTFTLQPQQLVVNGIDLCGTYSAITHAPTDFLISETGVIVLDEDGSPLTTEGQYLAIPFQPYTAIQTLINYINTGTMDGSGYQPLIPNVYAAMQGNNFVLLSEYASSIQISTNGRPFATNFLITESGSVIISETDGPMIAENGPVLSNQLIPFHQEGLAHVPCGCGQCGRCTQFNQHGECNQITPCESPGYPKNYNPFGLNNQSGNLPQNPPIPSFSLGTISFSNFALDQGYVLNTYYAMDQFYIDYWQYALADRICQMFDFETPANVTKQLDIYRQRLIKDAETIDLSGKRISVLGHAVGINYAQANIGRGFTTSGY